MKSAVPSTTVPTKKHEVTDEEYAELVRKLDELEAEEDAAAITTETVPATETKKSEPPKQQPRSILKKTSAYSTPAPAPVPADKVTFEPSPGPVALKIMPTNTIGAIVEHSENTTPEQPTQATQPVQPARVSRFKAARDAARQQQ